MTALRLTGPQTWSDLWTILASVAGFCVIVLPFVVKKAWPWWVKRKARREAEHIAIVGRDAILDPMSGKELSPAQPGIAQWMPATNEKIDKLTEAVAKMAANDERVGALEHQVAINTDEIAALKRAQQERIATRAENAAAMSMITQLHASKPPEDDEA